MILLLLVKYLTVMTSDRWRPKKEVKDCNDTEKKSVRRKETKRTDEEKPLLRNGDNTR